MGFPFGSTYPPGAMSRAYTYHSYLLIVPIMLPLILNKVVPSVLSAYSTQYDHSDFNQGSTLRQPILANQQSTSTKVLVHLLLLQRTQNAPNLEIPTALSASSSNKIARNQLTCARSKIPPYV